MHFIACGRSFQISVLSQLDISPKSRVLQHFTTRADQLRKGRHVLCVSCSSSCSPFTAGADSKQMVQSYTWLIQPRESGKPTITVAKLTQFSYENGDFELFFCVPLPLVYLTQPPFWKYQPDQLREGRHALCVTYSSSCPCYTAGQLCCTA